MSTALGIYLDPKRTPWAPKNCFPAHPPMLASCFLPAPSSFWSHRLGCALPELTGCLPGSFSFTDMQSGASDHQKEAQIWCSRAEGCLGQLGIARDWRSTVSPRLVTKSHWSNSVSQGRSDTLGGSAHPAAFLSPSANFFSWAILWWGRRTQGSPPVKCYLVTLGWRMHLARLPGPTWVSLTVYFVGDGPSTQRLSSRLD